MRQLNRQTAKMLSCKKKHFKHWAKMAQDRSRLISVMDFMIQTEQSQITKRESVWGEEFVGF